MLRKHKAASCTQGKSIGVDKAHKGQTRRRKRAATGTRTKSKVLEKIYFNLRNPASYSSPRRLWLAVRKSHPEITPEEVTDWLSGVDAYTLHRRVVTRFPRRKVITSGVDKQWQADLMDMRAISKENNGFKYVLAVIDVFSRYAFVRATRTKECTDIAEAFEDIIKKSKRKPVKLQTDSGKEFVGAPFQRMLKKRGIIHFSTEQDVKAQIVERFNRTFKEMVHRYFTHLGTLRYVKELQNFVHVYNNRAHRSLGGRAPGQINKRNEKQVYEEQYGDYIRAVRKPFKFSVNDRVRLSAYRKTFKRGYEKNFTSKIFTVVNQLDTQPPTYHVKDEEGEFIEGAFYEQEMQRVR